MRSTSRNGYRCGRMSRISLISKMAMEVVIIAYRAKPMTPQRRVIARGLPPM